MTREQWLQDATTELRSWASEHGATVPDVHVSVGWPRGSHGRARAIGQCWSAQAVEDGKPAIFISPELSEPARILDVLLHELVHAATPGAGHRKAFSALAASLGLVKPWTATTASADLKARLQALADRLGPLSHSKVNDAARKRQTTRMLKLKCSGCGYIVRTTAKWVEYGLPSCPDGDPLEVV